MKKRVEKEVLDDSYGTSLLEVYTPLKVTDLEVHRDTVLTGLGVFVT
jgi:hypothetical protein